MPIFISVEEHNGKGWQFTEELSIPNSTENWNILFKGIAANRTTIPGNASFPVIAAESHQFKNSRTHRAYTKTYGHLYVEEIRNIAAKELLEDNIENVKAARSLLKLFPKNTRGNHRIIYYSSGIG